VSRPARQGMEGNKDGETLRGLVPEEAPYFALPGRSHHSTSSSFVLQCTVPSAKGREAPKDKYLILFQLID